MDVKRTFNHISRNRLRRKMDPLGADGDLVRWTGSFISESKVRVVDCHQCKIVEVETGVPQGSLVSPILFAIDLHGIFKKMEK